MWEGNRGCRLVKDDLGRRNTRTLSGGMPKDQCVFLRVTFHWGLYGRLRQISAACGGTRRRREDPPHADQCKAAAVKARWYEMASSQFSMEKARASHTVSLREFSAISLDFPVEISYIHSRLIVVTRSERTEAVNPEVFFESGGRESVTHAKGGFVIVEAWAKTDVGKHRATNEDCLFIDPDLQLILVLDGMGGHRAGEVASQLAMETISSFYKEHVGQAHGNPEIFENYDPNFTFEANLLRQATYLANRVVIEKSLEKEEFVGMGSTLTGMAISNYTVSMINVGDSRMYLIRNGTIEQISKDHTLAEDQVERGIMSREEANESQLKHILSSVIGVDSRIRIHMDELSVMPGDTFLLCTDGLTAVLEDHEILAELLRDEPGPQLLDHLIDVVNQRGGPDNTTLALTVFSEDPDEIKQSRISSLISRTFGSKKK